MFCGSGELYRAVYRHNCVKYQGVDRKTIHDKALCVLQNNESYVKTHEIAQYDVIDLDDYGCPWKLLYLCMARLVKAEVIVFLTDGIPLKLHLDPRPALFVAATQRLPWDMKIPGFTRWYLEMFGSMLKVGEDKYGYRVEEAKYFWNPGKNVCYWYLRLCKIDVEISSK